MNKRKIKLWIGRFERCFMCGKIIYLRKDNLEYSLSYEDQGEYVETGCRKCSHKDLLKDLKKGDILNEIYYNNGDCYIK